MKKSFLIVGPIVAFLMLSPLFVAVVLVSLTSASADCEQQAHAVGPVAVPYVGSGVVRIAQANLKGSLSAAAFRADLQTTLSQGPDFVSLNEVSGRSDPQLTLNGYHVERTPRAKRSSQNGTAVLWRADRWSKVAGGREVILTRGPQKWDYDRGATWVTLQSIGSASGSEVGTVSMISVHHMINPANYGPNKPLRRQLYRAGLERVQELVTRLSAQGSVFVAGDFNSQYAANDPWGPRANLGAIGLHATFDELGAKTTHDGGGTIDYVFAQSAVAKPVSQWTRPLNSDHRLLVADLKVGGIGQDAESPADSEVRRHLLQLRFAPGYPTLSAEQADNATMIAQVALGELSLPRRALEIALAVAIQESKLANLDYGDRDSAGLFQQRPSQGWGSQAQVTNPRLATLAFFGRAQHTDNPGLLDVPGWSQLLLTVAAQQVQRSGTPDAYAQWAPAAGEIAAVFDPGGSSRAYDATNPAAAGCPASTTSTAYDGSCPATNSPAEAGLTPDALLVLRCVDAHFGPHTYGGVGDRATNPDSDHPAGRAVDIMIPEWDTRSGRAAGSRIADWLRARATELGITYVIWRAQIWSVEHAAEGWRPYSHPSGATDPTALHLNHVHASVAGNSGTGLAAGRIVVPVPANLAGTDAHNWHATGASWSKWHTGTDFSVPCGTPVLAAHDGTIEIDRSQAWAGRWLVKVTTGPGSLTTWYAHLHTLTVSAGVAVRAGQQIGSVGGDSPIDGNASGCHLHFEVHLRNGTIYGPDNVDPSEWLK